MPPKKYFIQTFGCQMNLADSERIAAEYQLRGFKPAKNWRTADEIIINTCSVRQRAEDRVVGLVKNINDYSRTPGVRKNKPRVIITGCIYHHGLKKLKQIFPTVKTFLPPGFVPFNHSSFRQDKAHAFVPISSGCNSFCTYCIVPYARGREVSRPSKEILQEIKDLIKAGYSEITLLGQNVNSYGLEKVGISIRKDPQSQYKKFTGNPPFVRLLKQILEIPQIKNLRFLTSNPWDFHQGLIDLIAQEPKIDRFIHLPIQSGSNRILEKMNRGYTREHYLDLVNRLQKAVPDMVLGTDIIVGFPTETKKDFQDTLDLAKEINFTLAFVAQYSPRPGTTAAKLFPDDVTPREKKRRWEILDDLINKPNLKSRPSFHTYLNS